MKTYLENKLLGFFIKTNGYFSRLFFSGIGHIITLHRVLPKSEFLIPENQNLEVTPTFLENLIHFYRSHDYEFISLDSLYNVLSKRKTKNKKKVVVLTFDDGYSDVYKYAYPILKKYNVPLNLYLTTGFPDNKAVLWWYLVEELIRDKSEIRIEFKEENIRINCKTPDEKQEVFIFFRNLILNNYHDYLNILENIFSKNGINIYNKSKDFALSWEEIIEMSKNPLVCIGAHTVNHPIFNKLTKDEIVDEIMNSKTIIEKHICKEVQHFAYPFGGKDEVGEREFKILKELPFKTCTTTRYSNIFTGHKNHLECLPRIYTGVGVSEEKMKNMLNGITQYSKNKFKRIIKD